MLCYYWGKTLLALRKKYTQNMCCEFDTWNPCFTVTGQYICTRFILLIQRKKGIFLFLFCFRNFKQSKFVKKKIKKIKWLLTSFLLFPICRNILVHKTIKKRPWVGEGSWIFAGVSRTLKRFKWLWITGPLYVSLFLLFKQYNSPNKRLCSVCCYIISTFKTYCSNRVCWIPNQKYCSLQ